MKPELPWPPCVGELLPRTNEAYTEPRKLAWVLGEEGHGPEWARVLRIGPQDTEVFWRAIGEAVRNAPISGVRDLRANGVNCEVETNLTIRKRRTPAVTVWHYIEARGAPRLVTAYPIR